MTIGNFEQLASLVLPEGLLAYFTIHRIERIADAYHIYLEEINQKPIEYGSDNLASKGFYEEINIQDFPIRGNKVYLHIRRRRWVNQTTGDIVNRDWDLVAKGTRMTQEFASFLKELARYTSGKR
jgi:hypothetical protein